MGQPITWRSLLTTSIQDAARPMEAATRTFDNAFDRMGAVLAQQQQANQTVVDTQRFAAEQDYRNLVQGAKTQGDLEALKPSLAAKLALLDPKAQAAVRGIDEQRFNTIIDNTKRNAEFKTWQEAEDYAPVREAYSRASLSGDKQTMQTLEQSYPGMRGWSGLLKEGALWNEKTKEFGRADEKHKQELKESNSRMDIAKGNLAVNQGQLGVSQKNLGLNEQRFQLEIAKQLDDQTTKVTERLGKVGAQYISNPDGYKAALTDISATIKDPRQLSEVTKYVSELAADPKNKHLTVAEVVALAEGSTIPGNVTSFFGRERGSDMATRAKAITAGDAYKTREGKVAAQEKVLLDQLKDFRSMIPGVPAPLTPAPSGVSLDQAIDRSTLPAKGQAAPVVAPATSSNVLPPAPVSVPGLSALAPMPKGTPAEQVLLAAITKAGVQEQQATQAAQEQVQATVTGKSSTAANMVARNTPLWAEQGMTTKEYRQVVASLPEATPALVNTLVANFEKVVAAKKAR